MLRTVSFSHKLISQFCAATRDYNIVHSAAYMHINEKKVVVPGMLLLSTILSDANLYLGKENSPNYFMIYFNSIVSEDDQVQIGCLPLNADRDCWQLSAINGKDCLSLHDNKSIMKCQVSSSLSISNGNLRLLPFDESQLFSFQQLTSFGDEATSSVLFAIAYGSMALNKAIANPESETEIEINRLLDKNINPNRVSPFYQSLEIELPLKPTRCNPGKELSYYIDFEREVFNKSYFANLICEQDHQKIFLARYQMVAIPDRLIMRKAKGLNEN